MKRILPILIVIVMVTMSLCACTSSSWIAEASCGDSYTMVLGYDQDNHILTGQQTVTTTNSTLECITAVKMHLYANNYNQDALIPIVPTSYYSAAYPNGESYGNITIDSVYIDGSAVAYTIEGTDNDILSIPCEVMQYESITIDISYTITLANIAHRLGYTDTTVNLGNFFPIICALTETGYDTTQYYNVGDPFVSSMSNYTVSLTVPSSYSVASTGQLTSSTTNGDSTTHNYTVTAVRDFAMVMSDQYQQLSTTLGDTTIYYYYYNDDDASGTLDTIVSTMQYMIDNVGDYPYSQYTVAQTDMCYGGMEYPNMVMASGNTSQYITAVVHETIHQWFYAMIGNDQIQYAWMDEGLTEFVTMLVLDELDIASMSSSIGSMYKAYTTYVDVLSNYYDNLDTSYRSLDQYTSDQDYVYTVYVKGSIMFYNIYNTMGSNKFISALQYYYNSCAGTIAQPSQLIDSFSHAFGADMSDMFASYIEGKDILYSQDSTTSTSSTYVPTIC